MQVDVGHVVLGLERAVGGRAGGEEARARLDQFIKAFYLPEGDVEAWALAAPYPPPHVLGLIATMSQVTKRTRLQITALLQSN